MLTLAGQPGYASIDIYILLVHEPEDWSVPFGENKSYYIFWQDIYPYSWKMYDSLAEVVAFGF